MTEADQKWFEENVKEEKDPNWISKSDTEGLPESPASANVKIWIKGFGCMFTIRGKEVLDVVNKTLTLISVAEKKGWKNVWGENESTAGDTGRKCPECGSPLKELKDKDGAVLGMKCSTN
jgi:hypothetical protein